MDCGFQIKELAKILGVTEDTLINWEKRGVSPTLKNFKKALEWMGDTSIRRMKERFNP
jgi:DNA-binding XRE family transcriptional regulator